MLRRNIQSLLTRENQHGLNNQENLFLQKMIKEYHQNDHELKTK
jgi:hypothetical protein